MTEDRDCGIVENICKKCEKSFPRAKDAIYHEKHCGECACDTCGKVFSNKLSLRRHSQTHEEKNKCESCNKAFSSRNSLKQHLKTHSSSREKNFTCRLCAANFTTMSNLKRHSKNCL